MKENSYIAEFMIVLGRVGSGDLNLSWMEKDVQSEGILISISEQTKFGQSEYI